MVTLLLDYFLLLFFSGKAAIQKRMQQPFGNKCRFPTYALSLAIRTVSRVSSTCTKTQESQAPLLRDTNILLVDI